MAIKLDNMNALRAEQGVRVTLDELVAAPDRMALRLLLGAMARRYRWRVWIVPRDGGGYLVLASATRGRVRRVGASWGDDDTLLGAVRIARLEINDCRRRDRGGRW